MDQITRDIYIGNAADAREYGGSDQFDNVISVAMGLELPSTTHSFDLHTGPRVHSQEGEFDTVVHVIREILAKKGEEPTLVHCRAGVERAPAVVATAMAIENDITFDDALQRIKDNRPQVNPTPPLRVLAKETVRETKMDTEPRDQ